MKQQRWATVTIIVLLMVFIGYIAVDLTFKGGKPDDVQVPDTASALNDSWFAEKTFSPEKGRLNAIALTDSGSVLAGGESFIACYDTSFNLLWEFTPELPVTAIAADGSRVYAACQNILTVLDQNGRKIAEYGPFEPGSYITSVAVSQTQLALADAATKKVFILNSGGELINIIDNDEDRFIIPSLYFDVAFDSGGNLYIAHTGNRRIEKRKTDGTLISWFGEAGTDKSAFCGCCNPAHFVIVSGGFVTSEKGINRIKILNPEGKFMEFVSSVNRFVPSLPLDIAASEGGVIYGANPADSRIYVFRRK